MFVRPPAKVNLGLAVGPPGADGYHSLRSIFLRVGLADALTVAFGAGPSDVLSVAGWDCSVKGNLVLRAFDLTRKALGHDLPPLVAHLDKRIPLAAGLGGGSSDAAAAVDSALQMWGASLAPDLHAALVVELGSDLPFFAASSVAAIVEGRGERVTPIDAPADLGVLLVTPSFRLSTAAVFARFDDLGSAARHSAPVEVDLTALVEQAATLRDANDLWPAAVALEPRLAMLRDELEALSGQPWLMSGSGSTLFALYATGAEAVAAGRALAAAAPDALSGAIINAVDLIGPDPLWRYP